MISAVFSCAAMNYNFVPTFRDNLSIFKSHAVKKIFLDYHSTLRKIPKEHRSQALGVLSPEGETVGAAG